MPLMDAEASAKPRRLRRPAGLRHANTTVLSPGDIGDQLASDASTERGTRHQAGDSPSRWPCESSRGVSPSTPLMGATPDQLARSCGGHRESHWSWRRSWITTGWQKTEMRHAGCSKGKVSQSPRAATCPRVAWCIGVGLRRSTMHLACIIHVMLMAHAPAHFSITTRCRSSSPEM